MLNDNQVYTSQFASMSFITLITFKMAMLPKYMASVAGNDSWISVMLLMAIEVTMYIIVYYVARRINLANEKNKLVITPIMLLIFLLSIVRVSILYSEMIDYTATALFDHNRSSFIVLAFAPVLGYLVYKGGNVLGRLCELMSYLVIAVLVAQLMLISIDVDWTNLLPIMVDSGEDMFKGMYTHVMWFGDYIPLLFFSVVENKNKKVSKVSLPLALSVGSVLVVAFFVVFTAAYGGSGIMVNYAFNKMAVFNKISSLVGATNGLSVTTWLIMSVLQLSLLIYSATSALSYFIKSKTASIVIVIVGISLVESYAIQKVDIGYVFATGWVKWFVAGVQYIVPIILLVYANYCAKSRKKANTNSSCEESKQIDYESGQSTATSTSCRSEVSV